jgi:hypothetical protein
MAKRHSTKKVVKLNGFVAEDICRMYASGMSAPQVSEKTGWNIGTVFSRVKKAGICRTRTEGIKIAASQGRVGSKVGQNLGIKRSKEVCEKIRRARIKWGKSHAVGYSLGSNGYYRFTRGKDKGRNVHVVIMKKHIGRNLHKTEVVHHVNEIRTDNRIENLQLMTRAEHARLHRLQTPNRARDKNGRYI